MELKNIKVGRTEAELKNLDLKLLYSQIVILCTTGGIRNVCFGSNVSNGIEQPTNELWALVESPCSCGKDHTEEIKKSLTAFNTKIITSKEQYALLTTTTEKIAFIEKLLNLK